MHSEPMLNSTVPTAKTLTPTTWRGMFALTSRNRDGSERRMKLSGVFVAGKGSPVIAHATERGKLQTKFGSVFCNDGDVVLAVQWLVRDESDAERRTFYEPSDEDEAGSVIPVNSTELRHAGFGLTVLEPSIRTACTAELESDVEDGW